VLPPKFLVVSTIVALINIASAMAFVLFCYVQIFGVIWEAYVIPQNMVLLLTPTGYGL
jgi:hypothetical protein